MRATEPRAAESELLQVSEEMATYDIGSIPPMQVRHGSSLQFRLRGPHDEGIRFKYVIEQRSPYAQPQGSITLDETSGIFRYTPASNDKFQFAVFFTSYSTLGQSTSQTVVITPIGDLPPETDVLRTNRQPPDRTSSDYLLVTETPRGAEEIFNTLQRRTFDIAISGKFVIFDPGSPLYGRLHTRLHNRPDIRTLVIYAETVVIRGALRLPGTTLTIHARDLRFEDTATPASFDTTPLGLATRAPQFQNGAEGQSGGDIYLFVRSVFSPGAAPRVIADGAAGQAAGQGRAGIRKPDLVVSTPLPQNAGPGPWRTWWNWGGWAVFPWPFQTASQGWVLRPNGSQLPYTELPYAGNLAVVYVQSDPPCGGEQGGIPRWPEDGENAVPPGLPGLGGAGGRVSSSNPSLAALVRALGGVSGASGDPQTGGPPQNPIYSAWLRTSMAPNCRFGSFILTAVHESKAGANAPSRPATRPQGQDGSFMLLPDDGELSWLHPNALRMVLAHARDTYRAGHLIETQTILQPYADTLADSTRLPVSFATELRQAKSEIDGLMFRIAANLDYFGNEAGWVPLLSLEATMGAFEAEVEAAVPLLFLSQWLQAQSRQNIKDTIALDEAMRRLRDSSEAVALDVNAGLDAFPALDVEAQGIDAQLQDLEVRLAQRRAELLAKAEHDVRERRRVPVWNKALRTVGLVAQMIPVAQPALGTIGKGLDVVLANLEKFDVDDPFEGIDTIREIAGQVKTSTCRTSIGPVKNRLSSIKIENAFEKVEELTKELEPCSTLVKDSTAIWRETGISDADVDRQFKALEAADGELQLWTQQTAEFMGRRKLFAQKLADTTGTVNSGQGQLTANLLAIASMYQELQSTATHVDHATVSYIVDMDRRARERLLRYQYDMAKAYEYRMLESYPGDLNIDRVVDRVIALMKTEGYDGLFNPAAMDAIKSVYLESVRQIVAAALAKLHTMERSLPFHFTLTPRQLARLNQIGAVDIDLAPVIAGLPNEENRHIADLSVARMVVTGGGTSGPVARVRVIVNQTGDAVVTSGDGHSYKFQFGTERERRQYTWGASHNLPDGPLSQERPSTAGLALLRKVLNLDASIDDLAIFARPPADTRVTIAKVQDPANLNATIQALELAVVVDFIRVPSAPARLNVRSNAAGSPHIIVDTRDLTERQDGVGNFSRRYHSGQMVTLTAEPRYGHLRFKEWVDAAGRRLGTAPGITFAVSGDASVQAVYGSAGSGKARYDFDGDARTDFTVYRRSTGVWYSTNLATFARSQQWGLSTDIPVPGDYDGDAKDDVAVWRPSTGMWYVSRSSDGSSTTRQWGAAEAPYYDVPVPGDYDGDGTTDFAVWRQSTGVWYVIRSSDGNVVGQQWGAANAPYNDVPAPGDYDGDGTTDIAVWRASTGVWYVIRSSDGVPISQQWGAGDAPYRDVAVPGDYDGDGTTDFAVWRRSTGVWYVIHSSDGTRVSVQWGAGYAPHNDVPVPGDYDGDGRLDFAVWRASSGVWYVLRSSDGRVFGYEWGIPMDIPIVAATPH